MTSRIPCQGFGGSGEARRQHLQCPCAGRPGHDEGGRRIGPGNGGPLGLPGPVVLAVTVLTSMDEQSLRERTQDNPVAAAGGKPPGPDGPALRACTAWLRRPRRSSCSGGPCGALRDPYAGRAAGLGGQGRPEADHDARRSGCRRAPITSLWAGPCSRQRTGKRRWRRSFRK